MATEVLELPSTQAIALPEIKVKKPYLLEREIIKRKADDEFNNQNIRILKPLKEVKVVKQKKDDFGRETTDFELVDYTPFIETNFEYYSRTRNLEASGERVEVLQNLVNKMTEGTEAMARVVIMNKGDSPDAFVAPEGTIFVSQSLINCLSSLDELGAILAHEVGHLITKTFESSALGGGGFNTLGIKWTHESAADTVAVYLCEKAGLKSTAFGLAIQSVAGSGRGFEHQAGTMRAAQNIGLHHAVDFSTSAQQLQKLPGILQREQPPTNQELAYQAIGKGDVRLFASIIEKLHPQDLKEIYSQITSSFPTDWDGGVSRERNPKKYDKALQLLKAGNGLLLKRLKAAGFSQDETMSFMVSLYGENRYLITSADQVVAISQIFEKNSHFERSNDKAEWFYNMSNKLFSSVLYPVGGGILPFSSFLNTATRHMRHADFEPNEEGIPFTQDSILSVLDNLKNYFTTGRIEADSASKMLFKYLEVGFYNPATESEQELDKIQVTDFLNEVTERKIFINHYAWKSQVENKIGSYEYQINQEIRLGAAEEDIPVKNLRILQDALKEWIGYKEREEIYDYRSYIDQEFAEFDNRELDRRLEGLFSLTSAVRESFDRRSITDAERLEVLRYLAEKIKSMKVVGKAAILEQAEGKKSSYYDKYLPTSEGIELDNRLVHFQLMLNSLTRIFPKDSPQFYTFLAEINQYLAIDWTTLNSVQIANLMGPLWAVSASDTNSDNYGLFLGDHYVSTGKLPYKMTKIEDFARLFSFVSFQELTKKQQGLRYSSVAEINDSLKNLFSRLFVGREKPGGDRLTDIFSDDPFSLLLFKPHRESLKELLAQGFGEAQYPHLYDFIQKHMPDGPNKSRFSREIQKRYLTSPSVSFEDRTEYLAQNFESLGPEGALILAEQIQELSVYRYFRGKMQDKLEGLLSGSNGLTKLFAADLITSELSRNFYELFSTTVSGPVSRKDVSTQLAIRWIQNFLKLPEDGQKKVPGTYDKQSGKFLLSDREREGFKSLSDIFAYLKNLGNSTRFGLALKALTDSYGAFSSDQNRESLREILLQSLNINPGFVSEVIKAACSKGEARLLGFPAASILSRRLFDALDLDSVDIERVKTTFLDKGNISSSAYEQVRIDQAFTNQEIQQILGSETRQLVTFGGKYTLQPGSLLDHEASVSDSGYQTILNILNSHFQESNGQFNGREKIPGLDPGTDAVVSGVEVGSALGVRSLQMGAQLLTLSEPIGRRFAQSFDANPGMNKLVFWERVYRTSQADQRFREFAETLKIGDYVGGGSLYTTYAATQRTESGQPRELVIKGLNTNAEALVDEYYELAGKVLAEVEKQGRTKDKSLARTARLLLAISREWCKADVHDQTYEADDDLFRQTIERFNISQKEATFYAPVREFTSFDFKSEAKAEVRTLNKILQDPNVSAQRKQQLVGTMAKFYGFQLSTPLTDQNGEIFYLVHSDPHVGNFIIDQQNKWAMIDRNMYLKLSQQEVDLVKMMISGKDNTRFVNALTGWVLDKRGITDRAKRWAVWSQVWFSLYKEAGAQALRGQQDNLAIIRTIFNQFADGNLEVPLSLRLMVRNVGAFKGLGEKYGAKLEDYM